MLMTKYSLFLIFFFLSFQGYLSNLEWTGQHTVLLYRETLK